ncbi:hypothetical protein DAPPUDRAFT_322054 [Daphnia pulex]|uniref:Uncharacterized protein n=1 Tax=Daphnia pulex TaxID=6669 RepID=E9GUG6_DAPPU|nr:hypothetical protein DAPPUDRAFT_322054 [Daphnia pulex]|eukprot:EFX76827.1 hypothetical protein DAPPUDRAFT_322054 [Daphnia pulex]
MLRFLMLIHVGICRCSKSQVISGSNFVETSSSTSKQFILGRDSSKDDEDFTDDGKDEKNDRDGPDMYNNDDIEQSIEQTEQSVDHKSYKLKCEENDKLKRQLATLQQQLTVLTSKQ